MNFGNSVTTDEATLQTFAASAGQIHGAASVKTQ